MGVDPIQSLLTSPQGRQIAKQLGVAVPPVLRRYAPGQPLLVGPALVGEAAGGRLTKPIRAVLEAVGASVVEPGTPVADDAKYGALIFDATGISSPAELVALHTFFKDPVRRLASNGRVIVLGTQPELTGSVDARIAQRALEGFTRSLGKELRGGSTAQLVLVAPGAEDRLESTILFLASSRSAFMDGQVIRVGTTVPGEAVIGDVGKPLEGKVVIVTGAARGIGAAMVATFARDGAIVLGVDIPQNASDLVAVTSKVGGSHVATDITLVDAPDRIVSAVKERYGSVHAVVHNAGITLDKKLVNMDQGRWTKVIDVNVVAPQRITAALVDSGVLAEGGRVVGISSIAGIAGNLGQTNYAASKAAVIGFVDALAPELATKGITVNAIAPGFIETAMTAKIPIVTREGGRRLSSLQQGGEPVDVAEAVGWLISPGSVGVTGNVVRVCGQGLIGA